MYMTRLMAFVSVVMVCSSLSAMRGPSFDIKETITAEQLAGLSSVTFPMYGATVCVGDILMSLYNLDDINQNITLRFRDAGTGEVIAKLNEIKTENPDAKRVLIVWQAMDDVMEEESKLLGLSLGLSVDYVMGQFGKKEFSLK